MNTRIVLDLNEEELVQFRRVMDEAPRAALNGSFLAKGLAALRHAGVQQPRAANPQHCGVCDALFPEECDGTHVEDLDPETLMLLRRQAS